MVTAEERLASALEFDPGLPAQRADDETGPTAEQDRHEIREIVEKIESAQLGIAELWSRMDADEALYQLTPFVPGPGEGISAEDAFTSNTPRVDADATIAFGAGANRVFRVIDDAANKQSREANANVERLAVGMYDLANQRRMNTGSPQIQDELMRFATVRGGFAVARARLLKDPRGQTQVDITPLDPRQVLVEFGDDEPVWAAHLSMKSRAKLKKEYGLDFPESGGGSGSRLERVIDYYDWMDSPQFGRIYFNSVIVGDRFAQRPAVIFTTSFPLKFRVVGSNPTMASFDLIREAGDRRPIPRIRGFGESIFAATRGTTQFKNRVFTYAMKLTAMAAQERFKVFSNSGTFRLQDNPAVKGAEIQLSRSQAQDVELMEVQQLTRDTQWLVAGVAGEQGAAGLSDIGKGIITAPVSGTALSIAGSADRRLIEPPLRAVESCLQACIESLIEQYETGFYEPLKVRGRTYDQQPFDRVIEPQHVSGHGMIRLELHAQLPEDQEGWMQMAALAKQAGLASDWYIQDTIMRIQDPELERERMLAQRARESTPITSLLTQLEAATREGDQGTVQFLEWQIQMLVEQQQMEQLARQAAFAMAFGQNALQAAAQDMGGPGGRNGGQNGAGSPRRVTSGMQPETAPLSGTMFGRPDPSPDAGFNTPSPRPGAQADEQRELNRLGLVGVNHAGNVFPQGG